MWSVVALWKTRTNLSYWYYINGGAFVSICDRSNEAERMSDILASLASLN